MTLGSMPNSLPILQTFSDHTMLTTWSPNLLVPMFDDGIGRVDDRPIQIKE